MFWGICLYKKPVKIWRCAIAKTCINLFCNIGLNTLWTSMLYGKGFMVLLPARAIKNAAMLIPEIVIVYGFLLFVDKVYFRGKSAQS